MIQVKSLKETHHIVFAVHVQKERAKLNTDLKHIAKTRT